MAWACGCVPECRSSRSGTKRRYFYMHRRCGRRAWSSGYGEETLQKGNAMTMQAAYSQAVMRGRHPASPLAHRWRVRRRGGVREGEVGRMRKCIVFCDCWPFSATIILWLCIFVPSLVLYQSCSSIDAIARRTYGHQPEASTLAIFIVVSSYTLVTFTTVFLVPLLIDWRGSK